MRECPECGCLSLELNPATNKWECLITYCGYSENGQTLEERIRWLEAKAEVMNEKIRRITNVLLTIAELHAKHRK